MEKVVVEESEGGGVACFCSVLASCKQLRYTPAMVEQVCEELMTFVTIIMDPNTTPERRRQCNEVKQHMKKQGDLSSLVFTRNCQCL